MRVVILTPSPLLLERVTRDDEGRIKSGYVVNGAWNLEFRGDELLAKSERHIVSRQQVARDSVVEIPVDPKWDGDYNEIIELAMRAHKAKATRRPRP